MLCNILTNELENAAQAFRSLPPAAQDEASTRYLMYKVAIRQGDRNMAVDCLRTVAKASTEDPKFIYACVLDAQEAEDRRCAVEAMKILAMRDDIGPTNELHLPALLRCTIRLLCSILESESKEDSAAETLMIDDICALFEQGRSQSVINLYRVDY